MKKIIGIIMLAIPFTGLFLFIGFDAGFLVATEIYIAAFLIVVWVELAHHLMAK